MLKHETLALHDLTLADEDAVRRILNTSDYTHYRFSPDEIAKIIQQLPTVGAFSVPSVRSGRRIGGTLRAFLVVNWSVRPSAWIGGFGVTWSEGEHYEAYLDALLPAIAERARDRGAKTLYYSGSDLDSDWLLHPFEARGFELVSLLRSYDKDDFAIPSQGNQRVRVRPFTPDDLDGVIAVENLSFDQLWRHDAASFLDARQTYPYFVVAEDEQGIVGYQFNIVDATMGYLVRIAVHPRVEGQGVGSRLMAEAVQYFQRHHVNKIVLNTEETNSRAHALYERFGFHRIEQRGFVLAHDIASLAQP